MTREPWLNVTQREHFCLNAHFFLDSTPSLRRTPLQPYALGYVVLFWGDCPISQYLSLPRILSQGVYPGNQQFSPADQLCLTREPEPGLSKELPLWSQNCFFSHATHYSMRYYASLSSCYSQQHEILREIIPKNRWSKRGLNRRSQASIPADSWRGKTPALTTRPRDLLINGLLLHIFRR